MYCLRDSLCRHIWGLQLVNTVEKVLFPNSLSGDIGWHFWREQVIRTVGFNAAQKEKVIFALILNIFNISTI